MKSLKYRFIVALQEKDRVDQLYFFKSDKEANDFIDTIEYLDISYIYSVIEDKENESSDLN